MDVPQDMAMSPDGELWFLDFNNYMVRKIDADGNVVTMVGSGLLGDSPTPEDVEAGLTEVPSATAQFNHTTDLFFHNGKLYLASWHNSRVKVVDLATMMMSNYAGKGVRTYYYGDGGPALEGALDLPSSIALDPEGNIVIMDQANQVIRRVNASDNTIERIAGQCVVDADTPCADGETPTKCLDSEKYVCGGDVESCFKPCTPSYGGDGGDCMTARIAQPFGQAADPAGRITYDPAGNLLFADTNNNRIRRVTPEGIIETVAGTGEGGYSGDGGPAAEAAIDHPVDVEAAEDGTVYFTDVYNDCVRKIGTDGVISTVAGKCGTRGFAGDGGDPLEAELNRPYGIELAGGKLYIADSYNQRLRVVNF